MTSLVTMTTTPAKETLFHVLSNGLCEMFLAVSIDFMYFFLDFLTFFYKEPVLNVPEISLSSTSNFETQHEMSTNPHWTIDRSSPRRQKRLLDFAKCYVCSSLKSSLFTREHVQHHIS